MKDYVKIAVIVLMAFGIISGAFIANAPEGFPLLWVIKAAAVSFTGIAGLLLNPGTPKA